MGAALAPKGCAMCVCQEGPCKVNNGKFVEVNVVDVHQVNFKTQEQQSPYWDPESKQAPDWDPASDPARDDCIDNDCSNIARVQQLLSPAPDQRQGKKSSRGGKQQIEPFKAVIDGSRNLPLGLVLSMDVFPSHLYIERILPIPSLIESWNASNPCAVRAGDVIAAVNGKNGTSRAMASWIKTDLQKGRSVELLIMDSNDADETRPSRRKRACSTCL